MRSAYRVSESVGWVKRQRVKATEKILFWNAPDVRTKSKLLLLARNYPPLLLTVPRSWASGMSTYQKLLRTIKYRACEGPDCRRFGRALQSSIDLRFDCKFHRWHSLGLPRSGSLPRGPWGHGPERAVSWFRLDGSKARMKAKWKVRRREATNDRHTKNGTNFVVGT